MRQKDWYVLLGLVEKKTNSLFNWCLEEMNISYIAYFVLIYIRTIFFKHLSKCQDGSTLTLTLHWKKIARINASQLNRRFFKFQLDSLGTNMKQGFFHILFQLCLISLWSVMPRMLYTMTVLISQCDFILFYKMTMFHFQMIISIKNLERKW